MERIEALAMYLEVTVDELTETDNDTFSLGNKEYLIMTDDDADTTTAEYIRDSLWAFNASWIVSHSMLPENDAVIKAVQTVQEELCESANDFVEAIIEDMDDFISDSIRADGRGHFLSNYDGKETFFEDKDGEEWYIYRTN